MTTAMSSVTVCLTRAVVGSPAAGRRLGPARSLRSIPQAAATVEFQNRIKAYLKIHNDAEAKVPNLRSTDDPKEVNGREVALGKMIATMRAGAQPGDIFAKEYQPYFIKIVQDDFKTRSAADRKALVVELPKNVKVDINMVYPTTLPLETFPAGSAAKAAGSAARARISHRRQEPDSA